ncbi:histidine phosphatase family protein [Rhodoblastus sp.]|uniref:histidine phosphatase family protein n=1 Tax=Rhodoblastus sp. TaxID=1962975 RepID=UPI003F99DF68
MTTRLKLLCHASTSAVRTSAFPADEPLDMQGRQKLAAFPHGLLRADRYLTSPALRASQTAEILQLNATVEPMLRDCDYGRWTGRSFDEVQTQEPEAVAEWVQNPGAAPHGGESILALMERVATWLDAQNGMSGQTVAVTHAAVIRAAIIHAIEAGTRSFWRIDVAPLSLTRLGGNNGRWTLVSVGTMKADSR